MSMQSGTMMQDPSVPSNMAPREQAPRKGVFVPRWGIIVSVVLLVLTGLVTGSTAGVVGGFKNGRENGIAAGRAEVIQSWQQTPNPFCFRAEEPGELPDAAVLTRINYRPTLQQWEMLDRLLCGSDKAFRFDNYFLIRFAQPNARLVGQSLETVFPGEHQAPDSFREFSSECTIRVDGTALKAYAANWYTLLGGVSVSEDFLEKAFGSRLRTVEHSNGRFISQFALARYEDETLAGLDALMKQHFPEENAFSRGSGC